MIAYEKNTRKLTALFAIAIVLPGLICGQAVTYAGETMGDPYDYGYEYEIPMGEVPVEEYTGVEDYVEPSAGEDLYGMPYGPLTEVGEAYTDTEVPGMDMDGIEIADDTAAVEPSPGDPGATDPGIADPGATDPSVADPGATDPAAGTSPGNPGAVGPGVTLTTAELAALIASYLDVIANLFQAQHDLDVALAANGLLFEQVRIAQQAYEHARRVWVAESDTAENLAMEAGMRVYYTDHADAHRPDAHPDETVAAFRAAIAVYDSVYEGHITPFVNALDAAEQTWDFALEQFQSSAENVINCHAIVSNLVVDMMALESQLRDAGIDPVTIY